MFEGLLGSLLSAGASIFGGMANRDAASKVAEQNAAMQRAVMEHGISMKAYDATQAEKDFGINRLTLLGAPSQSGWSNLVGDNSFGEGVSRAGQDIGRAVASLADKKSRADELNEKLLEAKIANVNADTVRLQSIASSVAVKLGQPGTGPGVPLPVEDPRGPVIPLMQRARDPRTGEIVWIPSEKAASPLQTLAASPINAAIAGGTVWDAVRGETRPFSTGGGFVAPGAAARAVDNTPWSVFSP